jgi:hypothetical protein
MSAVIVLNTDNTALHTVTVKHAIRMLVREVAIVEEARDGHHIGPYPWPLVLRLIATSRPPSSTLVPRPGLSAECCVVIIIGAPTVRAQQTLLIICSLSHVVERTAGRTPSRPALGATTARPTAPRPRPA